MKWKTDFNKCEKHRKRQKRKSLEKEHLKLIIETIEVNWKEDKCKKIS